MSLFSKSDAFLSTYTRVYITTINTCTTTVNLLNTSRCYFTNNTDKQQSNAIRSMNFKLLICVCITKGKFAKM